MTTNAAVAFERDNTLFIRTYDGTELSWADFRAQALKGLPSIIAGDMARSQKLGEAGNYNISFDSKYFPANDRAKSREENDAIRSAAIATRFVVVGRLLEALTKAGLSIGKDFQPKDSYPDAKDRNVWHPTSQIWINLGGSRTATAAPARQTDEQLQMQAMKYDVDRVTQLIENDKYFSEDGSVSNWGRAMLQAVIARGQTNTSIAKPEAPQEPAEPQAEADDSMPTD